MDFSIDTVGAKKAGKKSGYDLNQVNEGTKRREEVAFMSLPNLLANPSQGQQTSQTCFNA